MAKQRKPKVTVYGLLNKVTIATDQPQPGKPPKKKPGKSDPAK